MLTIRQEQIAVFGGPKESAFLKEMAGHLRTHFPERAESLDEDACHAKVASAVAKGKGLGLTSKRDLCRYLNLVGICGWEFEKEEKYAWIPSRLKDPAVSSPSERLGIVISRCTKQLETEQNNRELRQAAGIYDEAHRL